MRNFREPTCKNLLKRPLIWGVEMNYLISLVVGVALIELCVQKSPILSLANLCLAFLVYLGLRIFTARSKPGAFETVIFFLESRILQRFRQSLGVPALTAHSLEDFAITSPDSLDEESLLLLKLSLADRLRQIQANQRLNLCFKFSRLGTSVFELKNENPEALISRHLKLQDLTQSFFEESFFYSLVDLPSSTDPLWLFSQLSKLDAEFSVLVSVRGLDPSESKKQIEVARRLAVSVGDSLQSVDSEVTFEESSRVLEGLVRGDDSVIEISVTLTSSTPLKLDDNYFILEKNPFLTLASASGLRKTLHRGLVDR